MKSYRFLAFKELKVQKITTFLILIAIILSTMMTTIIGQSIGVLDTMMQKQASELNGNRHVTFHGLSEDVMKAISKGERLSFAEHYIKVGITDIEDSGLSIFLWEYHGDSLSAYEKHSQLQTGKLPTSKNEIALPEDVLQLLGFQGGIGDTIELESRIGFYDGVDEDEYNFSNKYILTGILKSDYTAYGSGITMGILGEDTGKELLPEKYLVYSLDVRMYDVESFQETVDDISSKYQIPEKSIQYNWIFLETLGVSFDNENPAENMSGFSFMTIAGVLVGALVLLAAGLVIYNIFKISITKRIKEYGTLRAMGSEKHQIYTLVMIEMFLLCMIGIPIGMIIGYLSSESILTIATTALNSEIFMASSKEELKAMIADNSTAKWMPMAMSGLLSFVFALAAVMPAATYASKVTPVIAMAGTTVTIKRRNRKLKKIKNFERFYAKLNLKRNTGRTLLTVMSLAMSITVFVALQKFITVLDVSNQLQSEWDYSLTSETIGFPKESLGELNNSDMVASIAAKAMTNYFSLMSSEAPADLLHASEIPNNIELDSRIITEMVGVNEILFDDFVDKAISEEEITLFKEGKACIIRKPMLSMPGSEEIIYEEVKVPDILEIKQETLDIIDVKEWNEGITASTGMIGNAIQIIVIDEIYSKITGLYDYHELRVKLESEADKLQGDALIEEFSKKATGSYFISYEKMNEEFKESAEQITMLAWGFILMIGLIGVLNIINTVYTNIHTRIREIGVGRAIGMDVKSLYKTFLWEGAFYGIYASLIGGGLGYICTIFVNGVITESLALVAIPIVPIMTASSISVVACLVATYIPLLGIAKLSIVKSIETIE